MKMLQYFLAIGGLTLLTGCFQSDTLVMVQPDGSGTVTESFVVGKAALEQLKQVAVGLTASIQRGGATNAAAPFEVMNEKKLRADAGKMGEGVTFVSAKKLVNDFGEGYTVTYAFKDISKLKLNQNRAGNLPEGPRGDSDADNHPAPGSPEPDLDRLVHEAEYITFDFKKGSVAELTIHTPAKSAGAAPTPAPKEVKASAAPDADAMQQMMLGTMLKDMRTTLAVQVGGKIEKTDAEHVDGAKVTLMAMDFNQLLADSAKTKAFVQAQPESLEDAKKLMRSIPGVKAELKDTVKITFK